MKKIIIATLSIVALVFIGFWVYFMQTTNETLRKIEIDKQNIYRVLQKHEIMVAHHDAAWVVLMRSFDEKTRNQFIAETSKLVTEIASTTANSTK